MKQLHLLSGGAAFGLVSALAPAFEREHGVEIKGTYSAVGAMREQLLAGADCDLLILTAGMLQDLAASGHVVAESITPLGIVKTAIAVKVGEAMPAVSTSDELRQVFLAAKGVYIPDPIKSTAGIHVMKVLNNLGIAEAVAGQIRAFANGATAMAAMAKSTEAGLIGCTQTTEILSTEGVSWVADLPKAHELATVYAAGVSVEAKLPEMAAHFSRVLSNDTNLNIRQSAGFFN